MNRGYWLLQRSGDMPLSTDASEPGAFSLRESLGFLFPSLSLFAFAHHVAVPSAFREPTTIAGLTNFATDRLMSASIVGVVI